MIEIKKQEMQSLVKSLKKLISGKIQKIKQISDDSFLFEIYVNKKRKFLVITPQIAFLTEKSYNLEQTKQFYNILKKYLLNQKIQNIRQYDSDRIIEIETNDYIVYLELFRTGNIILTDKSNKIIDAFIKRSWKTRIIKPEFNYEYPPSSKFVIKQEDIDNINQILEKRFEKYISEKKKKDNKLERIRKAQQEKLQELVWLLIEVFLKNGLNMITKYPVMRINF